ncbi:hypothetical protein F751_3829 [Auxenochlorella protothecoides]|uniref:Translocon-associated protein subunit alpha n=1 Tax=Auxenochlorella protothecoides TaxID=3075 RepID=A0A087SRG5_AUXPR|nr:hypothetical protein F751_3829 [Auxenochlorella protothecoides]KFM28319.1 hypothetical protein F751_3829 [Auxenochlorella protothecoides]
MDRSVAMALLCLSLVGSALAAQSIEVKSWFPENPTNEFLPGKEVKAVLGLHNAGSSALNAYPPTVQYLNNIPLAPQQEASVDYTLHFPTQVPPHEFLLKLVLYTTVDEQLEGHLVYNQTIFVIEPALWIDLQLIGLYLIGLAVLALAGYFGLGWAKSKGYVKKTRKSKLTKTAPGPADKSDYLKGTHGHEFLRKRSGKLSD